ncbi:hypothetical protein [Nocardioides dongkuii]|uniref:hypothetical protein n=1 Tax=Nocardioides dongkuii TaxID=2760089 RepID=UPI00187877E8|nr:hypothetical protein [Nocardioides dongkuii]
MPARPPAATRRTAVGAALLGLVAVGGCDLDDLDPRSDPAPGSGEPSEPPADADADLVETVVTALSTALAATSAVPPRDRAALRPLARLHRRHLAELGADEPVEGGVASMTAAQVRSREERLQRRLADWAVQAESGELARVLASMSAAVAQQLALPAPRPRGAGGGS